MCQDDVDLLPGFDAAALPARRLIEMDWAGRRFIDARMELLRMGRTIVDEVAGERIDSFCHYPRGDVYDFHSHSQFYFHIHREDEHGHFHTFLRPRGMPIHLQPADPSEHRPPGDNDALSHLIAIAVDHRGEPVSLFTTNRWVTAETWYRAADVCAMLPCFRVDHDRPSLVLNCWVTAAVELFRPQIEQLLFARDAMIDRCRHRLAGIPVFEDRDLEVTSRMAIDVDDQLDRIRHALAATKTPPEGGVF
jgi:hypothetical protein